MKLSVVLSLSALVTLGGASCAKPSRLATPEPSAADSTVGVIPVRVGRFRLISSRPVTDLPTDTIYRFSDSSSTGISVFRYAIPPDVRVGTDSSAWLDKEGAKF